MPRLDNSDELVIYDFELNFDPDDPGATNPVDICNVCEWQIGLGTYPVIFYHPPYEDGEYYCAICKARLADCDDESEA